MEGSELQARLQLRAARRAACATAQQRQKRAARRRRSQRTRRLQMAAPCRSAVASGALCALSLVLRRRGGCSRSSSRASTSSAGLARVFAAAVRPCLARRVRTELRRANRGSALLSGGAPWQLYRSCTGVRFLFGFDSQCASGRCVGAKESCSRGKAEQLHASRFASRLVPLLSGVQGCDSARAVWIRFSGTHARRSSLVRSFERPPWEVEHARRRAAGVSGVDPRPPAARPATGGARHVASSICVAELVTSPGPEISVTGSFWVTGGKTQQLSWLGTDWKLEKKISWPFRHPGMGHF